MTTAKKFIEGFKEQGWNFNPFDKMLKLQKSDSKELFNILMLAITEIPGGGTFIDAALSFVSEDEFKELISESVKILRENNKSEIANSMIAYASLQVPHLLKPYLKEFLSLKPNDGSYYDLWPWGVGGQKEFDILKNIIVDENSKGLKRRAWECLVSIRNAETMLEASRLYETVRQIMRSPNLSFDAYSHAVGLEVNKDKVTKLFFDNCFHMVFDKDFFGKQKKPSWLSKDNHPTWNLEDSNSITASFGGDIDSDCGLCGNQLHRLLEIDKSSENLGIDLGVEKITIATCLSCLGWEDAPLNYHHTAGGKPESLDKREGKIKPQFLAESLKPTQVSIVKTPNRWLVQDWALSNSRENLNRLGGIPSWIQSAEYPDCPCCKDTMKFLVQFDSDLPAISEEEWLWGSGGICYVFWCSKCRVSSTFWQCT